MFIITSILSHRSLKSIWETCYLEDIFHLKAEGVNIKRFKDLINMKRLSKKISRKTMKSLPKKLLIFFPLGTKDFLHIIYNQPRYWNLKLFSINHPQRHFIAFRFTLEMISHINHVITTPYGHAILFGSGGDGRATAAR